MKNKVRFPGKNEYASTIPLFISCFGDDREFMEEYYGSVLPDGRCSGKVDSGLTAVIETEDPGTGKAHIAAMVQVQFVNVSGDGYVRKIPYIMGVCTEERFRHRGFMDELMNSVMDRLTAEAYPWCFLVAVDTAIYRHLGFIYDRKLSSDECELLYADDGLDTASARILDSSIDSETFADHIGKLHVIR